VGEKAQWHECGGRMLLGDNTCDGVALLLPTELQWFCVWVSAAPPPIYVHMLLTMCAPSSTSAKFYLLQISKNVITAEVGMSVNNNMSLSEIWNNWLCCVRYNKLTALVLNCRVLIQRSFENCSQIKEANKKFALKKGSCVCVCVCVCVWERERERERER
jgi:hypothetical protein